jgi:hypothetical protein
LMKFPIFYWLEDSLPYPEESASESLFTLSPVLPLAGSMYRSVYYVLRVWRACYVHQYVRHIIVRVIADGVIMRRWLICSNASRGT